MQAEKPPHPDGLTGAITRRCKSPNGNSNTTATLKANKAAEVSTKREGHHAIINVKLMMKMIRARQRLSLRGMSDLKGS
jgi:hypothetical protein